MAVEAVLVTQYTLAITVCVMNVMDGLSSSCLRFGVSAVASKLGEDDGWILKSIKMVMGR